MMQKRDDLKEKRIREMKNLVLEDQLIKSYSDKIDINVIIEEVFQSDSIQVTCPLEPEPVMEFLTIERISRGSYKGQSIKPGNITLNIKKLIKELPDIALLVPNLAYDAWWLKVSAFLVLWRSLYRQATLELSNEHATAIVALWSNCNNEQRINKEKGYEITKGLFEQLELDILTWEKYMQLLLDLEKNAHLEIDDNGIWMREWVSVKY